MLFGSIIRRAEHAVESIVDQALSRALMAIPLLISAGFATASASVFLNAKYGPQWGNLILAGGFAIIGLVAALLVPAGGKGTAADLAQADANPAADGLPDQAPQPLTGSERELFNSIMSSAAPIAVPGLVRILLRNIPLLVALLAALYVFTRGGNEAPVAPAGEAAA